MYKKYPKMVYIKTQKFIKIEKEKKNIAGREKNLTARGWGCHKDDR